MGVIRIPGGMEEPAYAFFAYITPPHKIDSGGTVAEYAGLLAKSMRKGLPLKERFFTDPAHYKMAHYQILNALHGAGVMIFMEGTDGDAIYRRQDDARSRKELSTEIILAVDEVFRRHGAKPCFDIYFPHQSLRFALEKYHKNSFW